MNRVAACLILFIGAPVLSGPLSPPVGPVTSTHKTMTEVEPRTVINAINTPGDANSVFRIATPGSYYLAANVTGEFAKHGIEIASNNVTIDLNGFEVVGVAGALQGINGGPNPTFGGCTIRNGVIRDWPGGGAIFSLFSIGSIGNRFENLTLRNNMGSGLESRDASVVVGCIANGNTTGFLCGQGASYLNCTAYANGTGFSLEFGASLDHCTSRGNSGIGFSAGGDCAFTGCVASQNGGAGFDVNRSVLTGCQAVFNTGWAFDIGQQSSITGCIAHSSGTGGILANGNSIVRDNSVVAGTTGISISGEDSRIESNNVVDCTTGISVTSAGNLVIRNSVSGGTTRYSILAGNAAGPIVTTANVATNTIPTANFDY